MPGIGQFFWHKLPKSVADTGAVIEPDTDFVVVDVTVTVPETPPKGPLTPRLTDPVVLVSVEFRLVSVVETFSQNCGPVGDGCGNGIFTVLEGLGAGVL